MRSKYGNHEAGVFMGRRWFAKGCGVGLFGWEAVGGMSVYINLPVGFEEDAC